MKYKLLGRTGIADCTCSCGAKDGGSIISWSGGSARKKGWRFGQRRERSGIVAAPDIPIDMESNIY